MVRRKTTRRRSSNYHFLAIGLLGIGMAIASLIHNGSPQPANGSEGPPARRIDRLDVVELPVPKDRIPVGARLADYEFISLEFPPEQLPKGAIKDIEPYLQMYAAVPLPAHWPLITKNLAESSSAKNPLIEKIPDGMRAMTIKVDSTAAVEGWAGPDTYVDVLLIEQAKTSVIAEKVRILSAERRVEPVGEAGSPNVPSTVTVLVTQEQCLAINTAIPRGRIAFALRSQSDSAQWGERVFSFEEKKGQDKQVNRRNDQVEYIDETGQRRSYQVIDGELVPSEIPITTLGRRENNTSGARSPNTVDSSANVNQRKG